MRLKHIISFILIAVTHVAAIAGPARPTPVYLTQPDGTEFRARIKGDEFTRIKTTDSGHAIIQGSDGWWYYAIYDGNGKKKSSGWKVGAEVPGHILASSSIIPYRQLSESAAERRIQVLAIEEEPILKRIMSAGGVRTKSDSETGLTTTKHGLVILANFSDVSFKHTKEEFESLLNEEGYSVNGATGCAKEYFNDQFKGKLKFDFHVSDIVTLPRNRAYYGANDDDGTDKAPAEMIRDACRLADNEIDFSLYDDDGDGVVDNVFLFFAGQDEAEGASEDCIWAHAWYVRSGAGITLELDGTIIDRYACASELMTAYDTEGNIHEFISGIGTFCHEYSHTLGLPDFYDTDYEESGGIAAGLWRTTSLMDGGNYNNMGNTPPYYNALERMIVGISEPEELTESGTYTMDPTVDGGKSYMIKSDDGNEFFLFECRSAREWDAYIGGSGMLAYHIDMTDSSFKDWLYKNEVNINPDHQRVDLLEADGRADKFPTFDDYAANLTGFRGLFYPHNEVNSITELEFRNGESSACSFVSITMDHEGGLKFTFLGGDAEDIPPYAVNITKESFADAAIINFESSYTFEGDATVSWGRSGEERDTVMVSPYSPGRYAVILEGLESSGKTYEIDITFSSNGLEGESRSTSVMTKRMPSVNWPYIYLGSMERNEDGTFPHGAKCPLRVYGAVGAEEIRWEFNGKSISHDGDGYYRLDSNGTLKAIVYWGDGRTDKIAKKIVLTDE